MNINIDSKTYRYLQNASFLKIKIGSHLHETNNEKSDQDFLHIISTPLNWNHSIISSHHSLLYKENNEDHIFTTLQNFITNILSGDSTINYEALYSEEIKHNFLYLFLNKEKFNNFNLLKSYLGFAQRDLDQFKKTKNHKKLSHALRGIYAFETIKQNCYSNKIKDESLFNLILDVKNEKLDLNILNDLVKESENKVSLYRKDLSKMLDNKEIEKEVNLVFLKELNQKVIEFCSKNFYTNKVLEEAPIDWIYQK